MTGGPYTYEVRVHTDNGRIIRGHVTACDVEGAEVNVRWLVDREFGGGVASVEVEWIGAVGCGAYMVEVA